MLRLFSFICLLLCLAIIAFRTLDYVDPPVTDPLLFGFIKSDRYLPPGDSIGRVELYGPVQKLLAEDRRAYRSILFSSCAAFLAACGLFFSSRSKVSIKSPQATATAPPVVTEP
jgi:hypothetical protein